MTFVLQVQRNHIRRRALAVTPSYTVASTKATERAAVAGCTQTETTQGLKGQLKASRLHHFIVVHTEFFWGGGGLEYQTLNLQVLDGHLVCAAHIVIVVAAQWCASASCCGEQRVVRRRKKQFSVFLSFQSKIP